MNKLLLVMLSFFISAAGYAKTCFDCSGFYWGISGSFGGTQYRDAYAQDGRSFVGRLSLEAQYAMSDLFHLGLESGVQNGNSMRLNIPKSTLDAMGGEPVHIHIKPFVDVLGTVKITPFNSGFLSFVKAGVAYRHLQVDRNEVNDILRWTPELQAGLGYGFNDHSYFYIGYQHLFGHAVNYQINTETEQGTIENIPTQDAVLIGVSVLF
ncbi:MAG: outer membrane beta-barrel protein [Legionella sp.]|uniref:outer membrane beta-barrel protein n=1 Tax=Legionella sp. TaxID=459 RepID=UPI0039E57B98